MTPINSLIMCALTPKKSHLDALFQVAILLLLKLAIRTNILNSIIDNTKMEFKNLNLKLFIWVKNLNYLSIELEIT
jgi:hypothetical protein